jgi:hypothetical protein
VSGLCRLAPLAALTVLLTACQPAAQLVTLSATKGGLPPPFADGSTQSYEMLDSDGKTVSEGRFGSSSVEVVLRPGEYILVSWTRGDGTFEVGQRVPINPRDAGRTPMTGTAVSGRPGRVEASCRARVTVSERPVTVTVAGGPGACHISFRLGPSRQRLARGQRDRATAGAEARPSAATSERSNYYPPAR